MIVKQRTQASCYACGSPATTREHFPPKCFFPKGGNLQLKTVPSCIEHNNHKSTDDQYLLAHICMNAAQGDNLAKQIFYRSVAPGLMRGTGLRRLLTEGAEWLDHGARRYPVDVTRFDAFFDHLSLAIFFDRYQRPFDPETHLLKHVYLNLMSEDPIERQLKERALQMRATFFEEYRERITHFEADKIDELVYANDIIDPVGPNASITISHSFYGVFEVMSYLTYRPLLSRVRGLGRVL